MSQIYQHTQFGRTLVSVLGVVGVLAGGISFAVSLYVDGGWVIPALIIGIHVLLVVLFATLTIEVHEDRVEWWFALKLWTHSLTPDEIQSVDTTQTTFSDGWGIHFTKDGTLYNVSGYDAVVIEKRDGSKVLLGTDEPDVLRSALLRAAGETD